MHHKICENIVRSIFLKGIKPTIPPFLISPLTNPNPLNLTNISRTLLVQYRYALNPPFMVPNPVPLPNSVEPPPPKKNHIYNDNSLHVWLKSEGI